MGSKNYVRDAMLAEFADAAVDSLAEAAALLVEWAAAPVESAAPVSA